jgi:predicted enzyme related to lactoylglutathione lyase
MRLTINIDVPELDPAIEFYCSALGLSHSRNLDDDVAELTGAPVAIYLLANGKGSVPSISSQDTRRYDRHWMPIHLDFVVNNLAVSTKQAISAGAKQESECIAWKGSKCITFADPFGRGFCLIEFEEGTYSDSEN